ncbi:glycosyl transferase [Flavobacterium suaedae]|uniref:Glycosyl transferase n=1 Tax=Flavobacterium suaedae TaxID=1767027 RepID=A0ABQ1K4W0_9FLAO|nr:glycosyltransferase [Flavobacterium suaedae]GGB86522.1 glycosyl transferase [Flavobacterium suaedae]
MLSILIPTYNYSITALVNEVYKQCTQNNIVFEIIAIDDCSTESFLKENRAINMLENSRLLENTKNLGRTLSRKLLAETATFEMLLFLDADVIPVSENFIKDYLLYIENKTEVVLGGYAYTDNPPESDKMLRYMYGKEREEQPASVRNKTPYGYVFSGNILIRKAIFIKYNYAENENFYGMDVYFSYNLYVNDIPVIHIDNPIYHLGLEKNEVFFKKSIEAVAVRHKLLHKTPDIDAVNGLMKYYKKLSKVGLKKVVGIGFKITEPILKRMILKKKPNLFFLDIYRLGYICTLK